MSAPQCSRGWAQRCAEATCTKCRCKCGGANHGTRAGRKPVQQELALDAQPESPAPAVTQRLRRIIAGAL